MSGIRAVIDTNVFVSGIISPKGSPYKVLNAARKELFRVVTSFSINHEILNVIHREHIYTKYHLDEDILNGITSFLYEGTVITGEKIKVEHIKADPADDKFLSCAIEGEADYIISGDVHLLTLKHYKGIQIVNAATFMQIITSQELDVT
ncbi:putative toxin-antitoxin system toxin component, PIN family [Candidatus Magnetominusculus dajiuhuensis]|uniref:putative toxin-antitoxin system toxin component, PIN family n=1 Tax=Candidatus Magnetominusculus dajiuhuensis TaxID=3137712 RepID=UPI003B42C205